jgi:hypothetical protein
MKANPGGRIAPENVFGRDRLIETIWERLDQQCVLINAERRIGKTSIINKMVASPPDKWFPIYQDLERIHSAADFASEVYHVVQQFLGKWKIVANAAQRIYEDHEFSSVKKKTKKPWKSLLVSSIEDLVNQQTAQSLIMFWDEVPYMIDNIRKTDGEQVAAEVLDTLRSLRQQHPDLRMVFTGSIGLHHVLAGLHDAHIATAPVNDMFSVEVTPLAPADAESLAQQLLQGEQLDSSNIEDAATAIAVEADFFPFYIHHIVNGLKTDGLPAEPDHIEQLVARHLVDANDPWELAHFRTRIPIYYTSDNDAKLAHMILDGLAVDSQPRDVAALLEEVRLKGIEFDDRENLLRVLRLMERDHYLSRTLEGEYEFRFPLIRRWWKLDRGL